MEIRKATRMKAKLRLALSGTSGSGKTFSALQIAYGIGGKVGLIDTEHGSGDLYADTGDYDVITLDPPFTAARYLEAIHAFERAGYETIIIDSLTHAWAGDGGMLDKHGKLVDSGRARDSFSAWRSVTPDHNALVDAMLRSPCHIIATMRSKTEYVIETNEKGKSAPKKVGLAPVMRDGIEYEFTVAFEIDQNHVASSTKDRTRLFDGQFFTPTTATGTVLREWLETGADAPKVEYITEQQLGALRDMLAALEASESAFCDALGVSSLELLRAEKFAGAHDYLQRKVAAKAEAEMDVPQ